MTIFPDKSYREMTPEERQAALAFAKTAVHAAYEIEAEQFILHLSQQAEHGRLTSMADIDREIAIATHTSGATQPSRIGGLLQAQMLGGTLGRDDDLREVFDALSRFMHRLDLRERVARDLLPRLSLPAAPKPRHKL